MLFCTRAVEGSGWYTALDAGIGPEINNLFTTDLKRDNSQPREEKTVKDGAQTLGETKTATKTCNKYK